MSTLPTSRYGERAEAELAGLEGKVAVVTGAAQGIGAATAQRLAGDGAHVAVVDLTDDRAARTAAAIRCSGAEAIPIGCDVARADEAEACIDRVVDERGRIDILVNNAGVTRDNLVTKMSEEDWDVVMGVNLKSVFLMSRAAQRHMVAGYVTGQTLYIDGGLR